MRFLQSIVLIFWCASCSWNKTVIYGIGETESVNVAGDGSTANSILGNTYLAKNSTATRLIVNTLGTIVGFYAAGVASFNNKTVEAYQSGNAVVAKSNGQVIGYLGKTVPAGGLAPGQIVPLPPQMAPLAVPLLKK